ncbi:peptidylprolyl isomerase [Cyanobium sp. Morenito 9A2]|uniref:peptidylprolyl isomerase n=1 Tax=Cyanobium sp. Morenito 9A2 TaxID=2823718 RepID=UPI0020CD7428|nr:peptidylprolyl isomerase [Cyanobium sp. Morenito 9A2]MCP9850459.1 peptidylprolyl isomerase [Cyanobium sp. Morenito 9A2]
MSSDLWLTPAVVSQLARHNLLRPLLKQQALAELAADFPLPDPEARACFASFRKERGLEQPEALAGFLDANLLHEADLRVSAEQPYRLQKALEARFLARAGARFLSRKPQLDRLVYSLLRVQDPGLARELYLRIAEGEAEFSDLAVRYSQGPEKESRGIVGPVPLAQAHPHLVERLRSAAVGVVLEPFQVESWWLVVRLESQTDASLDEATRRQMAAELLEEWAEEQVLLRLKRLAQEGTSEPKAAAHPPAATPRVR